MVEIARVAKGTFLTASSKVSQSTSGGWCGRQGESGTVTTQRGDGGGKGLGTGLGAAVGLPDQRLFLIKDSCNDGGVGV